jgi:serine/threonine-protein kinase
MADEKVNNLGVGYSLSHYRILKKIGAGGMGEVFLATDTQLKRSVALKILPAEFCCDAERIQRFKQEARVASALNHPNIITIHEIGEVDDRLFIATEFIDGETLREKIKKNDLNVYESVRIAEQVAAGLSVAHGAHIIHRDIKPENIMIRRDGYAKILDFGLAKLIEKKLEILDAEAETQAQVNTRPGMIIGSVSYMSPEQARGRDIDERTDIWSLGVCLYEMLTGKNPFVGETISDSLAALIHIEPKPLDENLPIELQRIVRKTLQKDANKRYQTVKDLLIDLEDVTEELKFQNKLERTAAPQQEETKTQILNATTTDVAHTTSSAEYIAGEIKQHKRGFAVGLAILLLAAIGFGVWFFGNRQANLSNIESIAVLPFVNESGNADNEYLSDGMTETLISSLSQLPKLSVKARSSVFRFKGKDINPQIVANELSVQAVLLGRVIQRGEQLTLRLELVDARNENVIWSEQYNRKQADLVSLQTEIARDVSNKLKTKLSGADKQKLSKNYTENTEAYQLYLKGRYHWNKRTAADIRKSVDYFQQAIDKDPTYALAYAGLADAYILVANYTNTSPHDAYPKARAAAMKALEIDETLAEAHAALASVNDEYLWNFAEAEKEYKRAIELNPNYATARQWYAEYLLVMGRNEEATREIKRAQELDPLSLIINAIVGYTYMENRQYDQAIEQLRKTVEMDQNFPRARLYLALTYERKGMFEEAISEYEKHSILNGTSPEEAAKEAAALREAYKKSGANGYWRKQIKIYEKNRASRSDFLLTPLSIIASIYAQLGEKEQALALLEKAYEKREMDVTALKSPIYDPIRTDPRFQDLMRRVGLPQ